MSLFAGSSEAPPPPLADRMRPRRLEEVAGQEHLLGEDGALRDVLHSGHVPSLILWGPPGTGKTSLARLFAERGDLSFQAFSAVLSGLKEVREVVERARGERDAYGRGTLLFVDEIHRFNKAQQDAFLPHVEAGTLVLVGATTQNPSFEVNAALLSRCLVHPLHPLSEQAVVDVLRRALTDEERGLGRRELDAAPEALARIAVWCDGDARRALNLLEMAASSLDDGAILALEDVTRALGDRSLLYDRSGEEHYNLISALHKAVRGSDPDGALYWLARMLAAGEDPLYLARRLVRIASEDVGNADPRALPLCLAARETWRLLGAPEGELALAQATIYLAVAPKSNAVYRAYGAARQEVEEGRADPVPLHIRNASTPLMKEMGYGEGYTYDHDTETGVSAQTYLPGRLEGRRFYVPGDQGEERGLAERLERWRRLRSDRPPSGDAGEDEA